MQKTSRSSTRHGNINHHHLAHNVIQSPKRKKSPQPLKMTRSHSTFTTTRRSSFARHHTPTTTTIRHAPTHLSPRSSLQPLTESQRQRQQHHSISPVHSPSFSTTISSNHRTIPGSQHLRSPTMDSDVTQRKNQPLLSHNSKNNNSTTHSIPTHHNSHLSQYTLSLDDLISHTTIPTRGRDVNRSDSLTRSKNTKKHSQLIQTISHNKIDAKFDSSPSSSLSHSPTTSTPLTRFPRLNTHSKTFKPTQPSRFFSRILVLGGLSFIGYQYYQWKVGNEKYFESLDAMNNGDTATTAASDQGMVERIKEEKRIEEERDRALRVPILAKEFSREFIKKKEEPTVDNKLRDYERDLGTITNDFTNEEYPDEKEQIDRQYMKLLMDTMDKIVVPSAMFLNYHTSYPAAHAILRLQQGCCREEILENYRELMRINHPDVGGSAYLSAKITEAKELLTAVAPSNPGYVSKKDHWEKRIKDRDEEEYNEQLARRLDIIQRRKEIMEFRQRQWGTPSMNREPMVVENEASRRVHSLDFGILQMNRGEWPSIPFDGWKPRIFRTLDEDDRWAEYKKIRHEIKNAPLRREIDAYHQQQKLEWEMIKFEKDRFKHSKTLEKYRPEVSHRWEDELEKTPEEIKMDVFYNTTDNLLSQWRQKKVDFYTLRGTFGNENARGPFIERRKPKGRNPLRPVDPDVTHINTLRMQQHLGRAYYPNWERTERWKVSQWEPYQRWKHHRF